MREPGGIGFRAGRAGRWQGLGQAGRRVGSERRERLDAGGASVQSSVHADGRVVGGHDMNV
eukprot:1348255-Pleurochrysis_carterae.AAC.1